MSSPTIAGDPEQVAWLAREYARYAAGACDAARALRRIDTGAWVGPAGDAFRSAIGEVPDKLERGQASFAHAAAALSDYARVLRDAQSDAAAAGRRMADADAATANWQRQRSAYDGTARPKPASYDPGADDRRAAAHLLEAAHARVDAAARRTAAVLDDARRGAPHEPGLLSKAAHALGSFAKGAGEATWGLAELAWKTSPTYAMIDPQGFLDNAEDMAKGLVYGVEHPKELGKALLDYDTWRTDPARALGHLVPDLLLIVATAGTGEAGVAAGRAAEAAEATAELAGRGATVAAREAGVAEELAVALEERFGNPVQGALRFQGQGAYVGRDAWVPKVLTEGETVSVGAPFEGRFGVPAQSIEQVGTNARLYYEGVQVGSRAGEDGVARYRHLMNTYEVRKPLPVAESIAEANPQFGAGGLRQYFLPDDIDVLIREGYLSEPVTTEMTDIEARIGPKGLTTSEPPDDGRLAAVGATRGGCR